MTLWTAAHLVTAAQLAGDPAAAPAAVLPGAPRPPPPLGAAIEVGIDAAGDLRIQPDPPLSSVVSPTMAAEPPPAAAALAAAAAEVAALRLDPASGDGSGPLEGAARAAAILQLGERSDVSCHHQGLLGTCLALRPCIKAVASWPCRASVRAKTTAFLPVKICPQHLACV